MNYAIINSENNVTTVFNFTDEQYNNYVSNNPTITLYACPSNAIEGWVYTPENGLFTQIQPYPSWILKTDRTWEAPTAYPTDGKAYCWIEETLTWKKIGS